MNTYFIISKAEIASSSLTYTSIGYVLSKEDAEYVHDSEKMEAMVQWTNDNKSALEAETKTIDDFVTEAGFSMFYVNIQTTTDISGLSLSEITDLDNVEAV